MRKSVFLVAHSKVSFTSRGHFQCGLSLPHQNLSPSLQVAEKPPRPMLEGPDQRAVSARGRRWGSMGKASSGHQRPGLCEKGPPSSQGSPGVDFHASGGLGRGERSQTYLSSSTKALLQEITPHLSQLESVPESQALFK